jgi:hypothetical protein
VRWNPWVLTPILVFATFRSQGRDYRLTDVYGQAVEEILA